MIHDLYDFHRTPRRETAMLLGGYLLGMSSVFALIYEHKDTSSDMTLQGDALLSAILPCEGAEELMDFEGHVLLDGRCQPNGDKRAHPKNVRIYEDYDVKSDIIEELTGGQFVAAKCVLPSTYIYPDDTTKPREKQAPGLQSIAMPAAVVGSHWAVVEAKGRIGFIPSNQAIGVFVLDICTNEDLSLHNDQVA